MFGCFNRRRILRDGVMHPCGSDIEGDLIKVESEDAAAINLRYSNGAIGNVLLSEISPGRGNHLSLEITCEYGNLWWNEEDNNQLHVAKKGEGIQTEIFAFGNGFGDTFISLLQEFYKAVANGQASDSYPTFREGANICAICTAVYNSAKNDSHWVAVEE